jgi:transposase
MFDILPQTLTYWYKNYLSNYEPDQQSKKWHPGKVVESTKRGDIEKPLYVFKPSNIGDNMSIDDKAISHEGFTILSNTDTGKVALMVETTKSAVVEDALELFGSTLRKIKSISMDMSPTYIKACEMVLPCAKIVVDKFHVMQYVYEAVWRFYGNLKEELTAELSEGKEKTEKDIHILKDLELLRRCRYALVKPSDKWTGNNKENMNIILQKYPRLKQMYDLSQEFRKWYSLRADKTNALTIKSELHQWYNDVKKADFKELKTVVKMVKKHESYILNFFEHGHTNAKAERLNGKIKRLVANNYGVKNKDFLLYRIANYFA